MRTNPLLERLKFLAISASNLDEFFEVRVAGLVQQIEDGYTEAGPDGLTLVEERDVVSRETHEFVDDQYRCWNDKLRPALSEHGIRVLGLHELDSRARAFVEEYCEKELDLLLTPVTVDPGASFSASDQQSVVRGFSAAPPPAFGAHLHRRGHGAARLAAAGPAALGRNRRLHFSGRPGGLPRLADVSRLRHRFFGGVPRHAQQQSLPGGRRIAQPAGVGAHRAAQPAQGRCGTAGD